MARKRSKLGTRAAASNFALAAAAVLIGTAAVQATPPQRTALPGARSSAAPSTSPNAVTQQPAPALPADVIPAAVVHPSRATEPSPPRALPSAVIPPTWGDASGVTSSAVRSNETPEEVLAVVRRLFDGMREADSTKVRSVFAEGARFASVAAGAGGEEIQYTPVDGFVTSVGRSERRWDERVYDVEVRVDDGMAVVWAPYTFYLDGQVRHCGVNLMDFLRTNGQWKITQLTDTRRMEGCRQIPPGAGR